MRVRRYSELDILAPFSTTLRGLKGSRVKDSHGNFPKNSTVHVHTFPARAIERSIAPDILIEPNGIFFIKQSHQFIEFDSKA